MAWGRSTNTFVLHNVRSRLDVVYVWRATQSEVLLTFAPSKRCFQDFVGFYIFFYFPDVGIVIFNQEDYAMRSKESFKNNQLFLDHGFGHSARFIECWQARKDSMIVNHKFCILRLKWIASHSSQCKYLFRIQFGINFSDIWRISVLHSSRDKTFRVSCSAWWIPSEQSHLCTFSTHNPANYCTAAT